MMKNQATTSTPNKWENIVKVVLLVLLAPKIIANYLDKKLNPTLEMFFAPSVAEELVERWGQDGMITRCDEAHARFVDNALAKGWIAVNRSEDLEGSQAAYRRIFQGEVPPSEAVILSLINCR